MGEEEGEEPEGVQLRGTGRQGGEEGRGCEDEGKDAMRAGQQAILVRSIH